MQITKYKPHVKGSLLGFFDIKVPKWGGFVIHGCKLFQKNGHRWIAFPAREVEQDGETKFFSHCRFESKETMLAFTSEALKAIDEYAKQNGGESTTPT
jgi:DNA-binding cell septation regulator SpoVG